MNQADVYNLALAFLGVDPIRTTADPTKAAKVLTSVWETARDQVLGSFPWPRHTVRFAGETPEDLAWQAETGYSIDDHCVIGTSLYHCVQAGTSGSSAPSEFYAAFLQDGSAAWEYKAPVDFASAYAYQYIIPSRTMRILRVGSRSQYERMGPWIFTDEADAEITATVGSEEIWDWDPLMIQAIAKLLAALAGRSLGASYADIQVLRSEYLMDLATAQAQAAGEASEEPEHDTMWVNF